MDALLIKLLDGYGEGPLQWLHQLYRLDLLPYWNGGHLQLPCQPETTPGEEVLADYEVEHEHEPNSTTVLQVDLKVTSANILTMSPKEEKQAVGMWNNTREETLLKQLCENGVHCFCLQETRLRSNRTKLTEDFLIFQTAAIKGQGGMMVGFARNLAYGNNPSSGKPLFFQKDHFSVIGSAPHKLIVRVKAPGLRFILVGCHAPQSGQEEAKVQTWWTDLDATIPVKYRQWQTFWLGDFNARVGEAISPAINSCDADKENLNGRLLHDALLRWELWLPATWENVQDGPSGTWRHPGTGKWSRLDYLAPPISWTCTRAWVDEQFDITLHSEDHAAISGLFSFEQMWQDTGPRPFFRSYKGHGRVDQAVLKEHLTWQRPLQLDFNPAEDVHTHTFRLSQQIRHDCLPIGKTSNHQPLRPALTEETWELVKEKRGSRKSLWWWQADQRRTILRAVLRGWHRTSSECNLEEDLKLQDHNIAWHFFRFQMLGRKVTDAVRADTKKWIERLCDEMAWKDDGKFSKAFWNEVRRCLPQWRNRKKGHPPLSIEALEPQWVPHFAQLEAGHKVQPACHLRQCFQRQQHQPRQDGSLCLGDVPTLFDVEEVLRKATPGKAPGSDAIIPDILHWGAPVLGPSVHDLIMKIYVQMSEPLVFKGGRMAPLHKRASTEIADNYRGVMLLPCLSKVVHSLLRQRIVDALLPIKPVGLIGGFPKQRVTYGHHSVKTFHQIAQGVNCSSGTLYIDLKHAYHHLVRALSLGLSWDDSDLQETLEYMKDPEMKRRCKEQTTAEAPLANAIGSPHIMQLLREVHTDTFFSIQDQWVRTSRGSRPGSPLADMVFTALIMKLHEAFDAILLEDPDAKAAAEKMGTNPITITWADDITLEFACLEGKDLVPLLQRISGRVFGIFRDNGFLLNMMPGKTSALLTFRGKNAPDLRRLHLVEERGCAISFEDSVVWLPFVCSYKHLGAMATSSGTLDMELSVRIGMTMAAAAPIRKPLISNTRLQTKTRCTLVDSLLLSRLFFGAGGWEPLTDRQAKRLDSVVNKLYREACDAQFWRNSSLTDEVLLATFQLMPAKIRLMRDRLLYAAGVAHDGPAHLWNLLMVAHEKNPHRSWLSGLETDFEWLLQLSPDLREHTWTSSWETRVQFWKQNRSPWKKIVQRSVRRFLWQEATVIQVRLWHQRVFELLRAQGALLEGDPFQDESLQTTPETATCTCGRSFKSKQALSVHRWKVHKVFAPEYAFASGSVCGHCLRDFWTSKRLRQHLSYMPRDGSGNSCFQALVQGGSVTNTPTQAGPDPELKGINRLDSRQAEGPLPPPDQSKRTAIWEMRQSLEEVNTRLQQLGEENLTPEGWSDSIRQTLSQVTDCWFREWQAAYPRGPDGDELQDRWFEVLTNNPEYENEVVFPFLWWGENELEELHITWDDGIAARLAEDMFLKLAMTFEAHGLLRQRRKWELRIQNTSCAPPPPPHRPVNNQPANHVERWRRDCVLPGRYFHQGPWQQQLFEVNFAAHPKHETTTPILRSPSSRAYFIVLHLFSGRRRVGDFHDHLLRLWQAGAPDRELCIISLDTAIDEHTGDLRQSSETWRRVDTWARNGWIGGGLAGSPCETFSEARFNPLTDEQGNQIKGPRPLRSAESLWGIPGLRIRELRQLAQGSSFALQVLWLAFYCYIGGAPFISEHPAPPKDLTRPSVWRSALCRLLLKLPYAKLHILSQWKWGAESPKPTGFLCVHLPTFLASMHLHVAASIKPMPTAMGRASTGEFTTMKMKEYPEALSKGLAQSIFDRLQAQMRHHKTREANLTGPEWAAVEELTTMSCKVDPGKAMKSDWQG